MMNCVWNGAFVGFKEFLHRRNVLFQVDLGLLEGWFAHVRDFDRPPDDDVDGLEKRQRPSPAPPEHDGAEAEEARHAGHQACGHKRRTRPAPAEGVALAEGEGGHDGRPVAHGQLDEPNALSQEERLRLLLHVQTLLHAARYQDAHAPLFEELGHALARRRPQAQPRPQVTHERYVEHNAACKRHLSAFLAQMPREQARALAEMDQRQGKHRVRLKTDKVRTCRRKSCLVFELDSCWEAPLSSTYNPGS
mmetsp:Transcript_49663/g.94907  ORF Transcript_49663/g.94907 Transcript_49663/m.94907 type:complete len:249 (+) Transcript_49663:327-1073(+)